MVLFKDDTDTLKGWGLLLVIPEGHNEYVLECTNVLAWDWKKFVLLLNIQTL